MGYRGDPIKTEGQIADIYEKLRAIKHPTPGIIQEIINNSQLPCECDCFEITEEHTLDEAGTVTVHTGDLRWYPPFPCRITSIRASVNTAPTGSSIIIDVNKNGSTIFTASQNPEILAGAFTALAAGISDPLIALGDYLQFDVDQAGSTIAGSNLSITLGLLVPCGSFALSAPPPHFPDPCSPDSIAGISGLTVWLKADAITGLTDGQKITTWTDSSGNGHDGTQSITAAKFVYKTAQLNGLPIAELLNTDGAQWVDLGDLSAAFPTAATLVVLYKATDTGHVVYESQAHDTWWCYFGGEGCMGPFRSHRTCDVTNYPTTMFHDSQWHRVSVVSSSSTYEAYKDNVGQGAQAALYEAGNAHILGTDSLHTRNLTGGIAELLIYDRQLTTDELTTIDEYLVCKWGL